MKHCAVLTVAAATFGALWLHERRARIERQREDDCMAVVTLYDTIGRTAMLFKGIDPDTGERS